MGLEDCKICSEVTFSPDYCSLTTINFTRCRFKILPTSFPASLVSLRFESCSFKPANSVLSAEDSLRQFSKSLKRLVVLQELQFDIVEPSFCFDELKRLMADLPTPRLLTTMRLGLALRWTEDITPGSIVILYEYLASSRDHVSLNLKLRVESFFFLVVNEGFLKKELESLCLGWRILPEPSIELSNVPLT